MIIYVNDRNEVKDVGSSNDPSLIKKVIDDENNPLASWSKARICCYCVDVRDGQVCSFHPYVNSIIIEQLDRLGTDQNKADSEITDLQMGLCDAYEYADQTMAINQNQITDLEMAVCDLYEMIGG